MLAELAAANAAFAVIKQAVSNGKEIAAAGSAIAEFVGAKEKLQAKAQKKGNGSDLEEFMALEEIRVKQEQLREFMQLYGRAGLYNDYVSFCAEARKNRKQAKIDAEKRREKIKEIALKVILAILITALLSGVVTVLAIIAKKKGII